MKTLNMIAGTLVLSTLFISCNKNEYAPEIVDQEFTVEENSPAGTIIGIVRASDQDTDQVLAYEIVDGNDEGIFEIDPSRGTLSVSDPSNLDYESNTQIVMVVAVSDEHKNDPLESSAIVSVNVQDVNEFAPVIETREFTMDENPNNGQEIGLVQAADPEAHQAIIYQIAGSDEGGYVSIDSLSGMLSVLDSLGFDYETEQNLTVTVTVSDVHENSLSSDAEITIYLNDIPEEKQLVLSLQPDAASGKDAVVSYLVPNNNYGALEEIMLYAWTQDGILNTSRSLLDFDLSGIPPEARIDSAHLSLFFNYTSGYGDEHSGETNFFIRRIISDWDESSVSWNTQPSATPVNQVSVDGAGSPYQDFPEIDITTLIQDYTNDRDNSYGLFFRLVDEAAYKRLIFSSSDHPVQAIRPKLDVYYTIIE